MSPQAAGLSKKADLLVIVGTVLLAATASLFFHPPLLVVTALFSGLPSVYLLLRKPRFYKGPATAAIVFGVLWAPSFDFFATFNNAWSGTENTGLVFRFPSFMPLDLFLGYMIQVFSIAIFYDYFIAGKPSRRISSKAPRAAIAGVLVFILLMFLSRNAPDLIAARYGYLAAGLALTIPAFIILYHRQKLRMPALTTAPFFFFLYVLYELVALRLNLWRFPGQYLGIVDLFSLRLPFEELIFWIALSSVAISVYYAYFIRAEPDAGVLPVH